MGGRLTVILFFIDYHHFLHHISRLDLVDDFKSFIHFAETGVVAVEVFGVVAVVADEKLRSAGIAARVCHRQYAAVVVLIVAGKFTVDFVARAAGAIAVGAAALDDEVGDDPVEREAVVKAFVGKVNEVLNSVGSVLFEELDLHDALFGVDFSYLHG